MTTSHSIKGKHAKKRRHRSKKKKAKSKTKKKSIREVKAADSIAAEDSKVDDVAKSLHAFETDRERTRKQRQETDQVPANTVNGPLFELDWSEICQSIFGKSIDLKSCLREFEKELKSRKRGVSDKPKRMLRELFAFSNKHLLLHAAAADDDAPVAASAGKGTGKGRGKGKRKGDSRGRMKSPSNDMVSEAIVTVLVKYGLTNSSPNCLALLKHCLVCLINEYGELSLQSKMNILRSLSWLYECHIHSDAAADDMEGKRSSGELHEQMICALPMLLAWFDDCLAQCVPLLKEMCELESSTMASAAVSGDTSTSTSDNEYESGEEEEDDEEDSSERAVSSSKHRVRGKRENDAERDVLSVSMCLENSIKTMEIINRILCQILKFIERSYQDSCNCKEDDSRNVILSVRRALFEHLLGDEAKYSRIFGLISSCFAVNVSINRMTLERSFSLFENLIEFVDCFLRCFSLNMIDDNDSDYSIDIEMRKKEVQFESMCSRVLIDKLQMCNTLPLIANLAIGTSSIRIDRARDKRGGNGHDTSHEIEESKRVVDADDVSVRYAAKASEKRCEDDAVDDIDSVLLRKTEYEAADVLLSEPKLLCIVSKSFGILIKLMEINLNAVQQCILSSLSFELYHILNTLLIFVSNEFNYGFERKCQTNECIIDMSRNLLSFIGFCSLFNDEMRDIFRYWNHHGSSLMSLTGASSSLTSSSNSCILDKLMHLPMLYFCSPDGSLRLLTALIALALNNEQMTKEIRKHLSLTYLIKFIECNHEVYLGWEKTDDGVERGSARIVMTSADVALRQVNTKWDIDPSIVLYRFIFRQHFDKALAIDFFQKYQE